MDCHYNSFADSKNHFIGTVKPTVVKRYQCGYMRFFIRFFDEWLKTCV